MYQGQYLDRETRLHYNTFRYYDPDIGRFTQLDPIGLIGGYSLYQYVPNSLNLLDSLGLSCSYNSKSNR
ncbi:RHS repeat-associated core domain-containing protein [Gilliamella apicola]